MRTFAGSMLGLLLICGLATLFTHLFQLHGAVRPFAEMLLHSGYYQLNLTDIYIASVFITCSGAVTGTMTTTLPLIYPGSYIAILMLFLIKEMPARNLLNAPFVATEILNILVGSFGVIAVALCTVVFAALPCRLQTTKRADALIHEAPVIAGEPQIREHCSTPYAPLSQQ